MTNLRKALSDIIWNFVSIYTQLFNECCPVRKYKYNKVFSDKPWFIQGFVNACKRKNKLFRNFLWCRSTVNLAKYKRYRNKLTGILRCEEKRYYNNVLVNHKNDTKSSL